MRKLILSLLLAFCLPFAGVCQQYTIHQLAGAMKSSRISFDLQVNEMSLSVLYQGRHFVITSKDNGIKFICDGKQCYSVDSDAKEVYIESSSKISSILNPDSLEKMVSGESCSNGRIKGKISDPNDAQESFDFVLSNIKVSSASNDMSPFTFSVKGLDKSWVVTDMR